MVKFADLTTVAIGGEIEHLIQCSSEEELLAAVRGFFTKGDDFLLVGGGSNILPQDGPQSLPVVLLSPSESGFPNDGFIFAGEILDDVAKKLNFAALSGIPGTLGGAIVQNAGAYGAQIADYVQSVKVYDSAREEVHEYSADECAFRYRRSRFKGNGLREIVLSAKLTPAEEQQKIAYPGLAKALRTDLQSEANVAEIRAKVLQIRDEKGMLSWRFDYGNTSDENRFSTGSFFTNPSLPAQKFYDILEICKLSDNEVPHWGSNAGIKLSAAWLIEQSGIPKGFSLDAHSSAKVSSKHTLALVNARPDVSLSAKTSASLKHFDWDESSPGVSLAKGGGRDGVSEYLAPADLGGRVDGTARSASNRADSTTPGADMRALSQYIEKTVFEKFGVHLTPEVIIL